MTAAPKTDSLPPLARPVTTLLGVGPERSAQLGRLGIQTVEELLLHRPRRHEDRQHLVKIAELELGQPAICHGRVATLGVKWFKQHTRSVFELIVEDGSARLHCRWWNAPFMERYFAVGDEVLLFGKPLQLKPRTMDHPETELLEAGEETFIHLNRLTPIYPLTESLPQRWLRSLIWRTLQAFESEIREPYALAAAIPADGAGNGSRAAVSSARSSLLAALPSRARAIRMLHFPDAEEQVELARKRLALDEFVELQTSLQLRRRKFENRARGLPCGGDNRLIKPFLARLGFRLTESQTAVLRELRQDLSGAYPMRRLLQGDVGSGKTVVCACCALMCLESGYSVTLMAPTEILAEQHFLNFTRWLAGMDVTVVLKTGGRSAVLPPSVGAAPPAGATLTIGTHALLQPGFVPEKLGLVIIDEQHKFGVAQREQLVRKGDYPHLLVMTATPIPRTLGLTLYGELDVSTIASPPPGRGRIKTFVRTADKLAKVWEFIRAQLRQGRQAYVVYPRVEDTGDADDVKAVTREFDGIARELAPFETGLLHGRLNPSRKEEVMTAFRAGRLHVLVATSLVEVGLDVPNATVMLIENAEQFGLAQLHQMRGRIGRGAHDSFCILLSSANTREAQQRLAALERTSDGFEIAEADLKLRGPGELLGQHQSGMPSFRFGDLASDLALLEAARKIAARLTVAVPAASQKGMQPAPATLEHKQQ